MDIWLNTEANPELLKRLETSTTAKIMGSIVVSGIDTDNPEYELQVDNIIDETIDVEPPIEEFREIEPSDTIVEKEDLCNFAVSKGLRPRYGGRIWGQLARRYIAHHSPIKTPWHEQFKPYPFPVKFEHFDPEKYYGKAVSGLDLNSVRTYLEMIDLVVEQNGEEGNMYVAGKDMIPTHIDFLREFMDYRQSQEANSDTDS